MDYSSKSSLLEHTPPTENLAIAALDDHMRKPYKGLVRSLQQIGCMHVLDLYCQGLTSRQGHFQHDLEFTELQVSFLYYNQSGKISFPVFFPRSSQLTVCFLKYGIYHFYFVNQSFAVRGCLACRKLGFFLALHGW